MARRESYRPGEFCWAQLWTGDPWAAAAFYAAVLGWEAEEHAGGVRCRYEGHLVAGMGSHSSAARAGSPGSPGSPGSEASEADVGEAAVREAAVREAAASEAIASEDRPATWEGFVAVTDAAAAGQRAVASGGALRAVPEPRLGGLLARIDDPLGTTVGLWQAGTRFGAERVREVGSLCWVELWTSELASARKFYAEWAGWEWRAYANSATPYEVAHLGAQDCCGLMEPIEGLSVPRWVHYFSVVDAAVAVDRAVAAGGAVRTAPFPTPVGQVAALIDPQGGEFSILQRTGGC